MNKKILLNCKIYPDLDKDILTRLKELLNRFGIVDILFKFEDGIELTYDSSRIEPRSVSGLISFYDTKTLVRILTFSDNFGSLDIIGPGGIYENETSLFSIPTA